MKTVPRCRAAGTSYNIWARQCTFAAKAERVMNVETGERIPVCGVHANARYISEYRPREGSRYEPPVQHAITRWRSR